MQGNQPPAEEVARAEAMARALAEEDERQQRLGEFDVLAGTTYRPPIESTCVHGKTLGPCLMCADLEQRERRRLA